MKVLNSFKQKNIESGYLYFYIHFITEVICFYTLSSVIGDSIVLWIIPLVYDALAFVPQAIFGYISDKYKKVSLSLIGTALLIIALILFNNNIFSKVFSIAVLSIGNALIHVNGAEVTLSSSNGKMSHSAIFVSGGSFGVITGKLLANVIPYYFLIVVALTMIPFILLAETYRNKKSDACEKYNYANNKCSPYLIILFSTLVVIIRGYIGYGIPTSWNKSIIEAVLLYVFMGFGKAFGGIFIDSIGMKKTAIISVLLSLPFLLFGDNIMIVSLIGVFLFSMTMPITLGLIVSVLKNKPGLSFGFTTIGLFLGTLPIFFIKITSFYLNIGLILFMNIICMFMLLKIVNKESKI